MDVNKIVTLDDYEEYLHDVKRHNKRVSEAADLLGRRKDFQKNKVIVSNDKRITEREFIEIIALRRLNNYDESSGGANTAAEDETDRLYAKNPYKFAEEFLQNADDCTYTDVPKIDITISEITSGKTTRSFVEFAYNEVGFSRDDIWAITAFSNSTKINDLIDNVQPEGVFYTEKTGRKGKGFKSVFSLRTNADNVIVHIRSNGFSFKLDNEIGRIMPVWEDDPSRMDGKTHVIVELVNPKFSVKDIYPEFRRLFCVDNSEEIFEKSPFLFMHRIKSVHVSKKDKDGFDEFKTEYIENPSKTVYKEPFELDARKTILGGIANKGHYYHEQYQEGRIVATSDAVKVDVPVVRYTNMLEDNAAYRNYSIMAPIIKDAGDDRWVKGSLFRTFPMSLHSYDMPIAIDAPFELNPDRSGIQYRDEKQEIINSSEWNTEVTNCLFADNGVFDKFLRWLRKIDGIRIDKYLRQESIWIFDDKANSDGHGHTWVPKIDLSSITHEIPLFHLFADNTKYVSYNKAETVNKDLFTWPCTDSLFSLMLGKDYVDRILSDFYIGSSLFRAKPIVKENFVDVMNQYLDEVEGKLSLESDDFIQFVNAQLYPYLRDNAALIVNKAPEAFKALKIYINVIHGGTGNRIVRESYSTDLIWLHSSDAEKQSINRFRILESSPVNISILKRQFAAVFAEDTIDDYFVKDAKKHAKECFSWDEVKDYLEAAFYYGYAVEKLSFPALDKYALSEELDEEFNAFRSTGVVEIIDDYDILELDAYFDDLDKLLAILKTAGLKKAKAYFKESGNYLTFRKDTLAVLSSDQITETILKCIKIEKQNIGKDINATYAELAKCNDEVLLFFLNDRNKLFSTDSYASICDAVQEKSEYWQREDVTARYILIRACAGATNTITRKNNRTIEIRISDILSQHLESCVISIISNVRIGNLTIVNDGSFARIPDEEIYPLIRHLKPDSVNENISYYVGSLKQYGGKKLYLRDGKSGHVYLHCEEDGDYKSALENCLNTSFNPDMLRYLSEMEEKHQEVKEKEIIPIFNRTGHDLSRTYNEIERRFGNYTNEQIINILSWFRYSGYTNALGNGNINNEREIEDDYRNDPWKFIYEFIQNVDDCEFHKSKKPELNIAVDEKAGKIVFDYNEIGFTLDDIKALTKFGDSNKKGVLDEMPEDGAYDIEKTGRKGRGFKSVFALPGSGIVVHIASRGFTFKFVKQLGSIIPIWEDIDDAPKTGTRIIVEGFNSNYIDTLYENINQMFGVTDISSFCSVCPILYLRKLNKVSVKNREKEFSIEISPKKKTFSESGYICQNSITGAVVSGKEYKASLWENVYVSIIVNGKKTWFDAVRYSAMFDQGHTTKIASVFAPVILKDSELAFKNGSIFSTLPLSDHVLSIPLSINAPFVVNSGRTAIDDSKKYNVSTLDFVFGMLLRGFYEHLRELKNIKIQAYIPANIEKLLSNYVNLNSVDLQSVVKQIPILHSYEGNSFVSCENAVVLPEECYYWQSPEVLAKCFGTGNRVLVQREYAASKIAKFMIQLKTKEFAKKLNEYLELIQGKGEDYIFLFRKYIYPYISRNYDDILKKYREANTTQELKSLRIFCFRQLDGSIERIDANPDAIWVKNAPTGKNSFDRYHIVDTSSIAAEYENMAWISDLHPVIDFKEAFTTDYLKGNRSSSWHDVEKILSTLLYYDVTSTGKIAFLKKCALSENLDPTENMFRVGFEETGSKKILAYIISEEDFDAIRRICGTEYSNELIIDRLRQAGLKDPHEYFDTNGKGIYSLNESTLALLEKYCIDKEQAEEVLLSVLDEFQKIKVEKSSAHLQIPYDDVSECSAAVIATIFDFELLSGEMERQLAGEYCSHVHKIDDDDQAEAFLRAANILGEIKQKTTINLPLSVIIERGLGKCVQNCKLNNIDTLELYIEADIDIEEYPSHEIDLALKWLDDKAAVSVSYEYYTVDLQKAFGSVDKKEICFLFDDEKVLLHAASAENSMLNFVQKRYKGRDANFKSLVAIITEQNTLKAHWEDGEEKYIKKLADFRKSTWDKLKVLAPDYDKHINDANGKAKDYILPELLQNINDCQFGEGQTSRTLNVSIDEDAGTMVLQYDEAGFDYANVYSITAIGQTSKHDKSEGEKGLGFKKVFSLFSDVEIYSNGFSFSLNADEMTVPKWIPNSKIKSDYKVTGKTTMKFTVSQGHKKYLKDIVEQWRQLMDGKYVGNYVSPLFLKNIDFIYVDGFESYYSRTEMMKEFIFSSIPVLKTYRHILREADVENVDYLMRQIKEVLKDRRKCKAMDSPKEIEDYLESLTFEICIPRNPAKVTAGSGLFYSTLPTESSTKSKLFMNVPLELTTGRDGIIDISPFNTKMKEMLFVPYNEDTPSLLTYVLESIAKKNSQLFMLNYIMGNFEEMITSLANDDEEAYEKIKIAFEKAKLFRQHRTGALACIADGYSVDSIICRYIATVKTPVNDVSEWMKKRASNVSDWKLILPSAKENDELKRFAEIVASAKGYFPIIETDVDLTLDYFKGEYGFMRKGDYDE